MRCEKRSLSRDLWDIGYQRKSFMAIARNIYNIFGYMSFVKSFFKHNLGSNDSM